MSRLQKVFMWAGIGVVGLVLLGAIAGNDQAPTSRDTPASKDADSSTAAGSNSEPSEAPKPAPEPVKVSIDGPFSTTRDQVTLRGTVSPPSARVRVNGARASVSGGDWTKVVQIKNKGDNDYKVVGSKPGHDKDVSTATVTRNLSVAEKAAARVARKQAFIASAQSYPYPQILAHPSRYEGKRVTYRGQIFQVQEGDGSTVVLLSVTDEGFDIWDDNIWVAYDGTIKGAEGDMLTVYGTLTGTQDYDTQIGGNTTVPRVRARYIVE